MKRQIIFLMSMLVTVSGVIAQNGGVTCSRQLYEYKGKPALWSNGLYQIGEGTYLEFVTIKNNSKKPVLLMGNASMHGNIVSKNDIEKNRLDFASKESTMWLYTLDSLDDFSDDLETEYKPIKFEPIKFDPKKPAKESYWESGGFLSAIFSGSIVGGITYPITYYIGVILKKADLLDNDRNLIRTALKFSAISGGLWALYSLIPSRVTVFNDIDSINAINAAKKKEVDEINAASKKEIDANNKIKRSNAKKAEAIVQLFDACDSNTSWLEVPTITIAPHESTTFALLVFGKHKITVFDSKSYKSSGYFELGLV